MRKCVLALLLSAVCFAADAPKTFTGVIHDNKCVGPECAVLCPINKNPVYTLQTEDEAWVLSDAKKWAPWVGRKVTLKATPAIGNKLKVISVAAAK